MSGKTEYFLHDCPKGAEWKQPEEILRLSEGRLAAVIMALHRRTEELSLELRRTKAEVENLTKRDIKLRAKEVATGKSESTS